MAYRLIFFMEILSEILDVEAAKAAEVASFLLAHFPVQELSIAGTPLEKIIESIYLGTSPLPAGK